MDQNEKVFSEVWIIFMVLLALANDALEIIADIIAFTGVGAVDEGIMEPIDLVFDGIFTTIFIAKTGFGTESFIQLVDDILELIFIPGRTITVVLGIYIANHPESAFGRGARLVGTIDGGELGELGEAAEIGQLGEVAAEGAEVAEGAAQGAAVAEGGGELAEEVEEARPSQKERKNSGSGNGGNDQEDEDQEDSELDPNLLQTEEEEDPTDPLARHIVGEDVVGEEDTKIK